MWKIIILGKDVFKGSRKVVIAACSNALHRISQSERMYDVAIRHGRTFVKQINILFINACCRNKL